MARLFVRATELAAQNKDFSEAFLQAQEEDRAKGHKIDELVLEVQNAFLHFPEYTQFLNADEIKRAFLGALSGPIEKELQTFLAKEVDDNASAILKAWLPSEQQATWKQTLKEKFVDIVKISSIPQTFKPMILQVLSTGSHDALISRALDGVETRLAQGEGLSKALSAELKGIRDGLGPMAKMFVKDSMLELNADQLFNFARFTAQASLSEKDRVVIRKVA